MTTPITGAELDAMEARAAAATPGPWQWRGHAITKRIYLNSLGPGYYTVMMPERWGFSGAWIRFRDPTGSLMVKPPLVQPEAHNPWRITDIDHPDAQFIATSRDDQPRLVAEVRRLRALVAEHHNVSRTGNVAQLGRVCPVCCALDPETRAALGLDTSPVAGQEVEG